MILLEQAIKGLTEDLSTILSKLSDGATPKNVHRLRTTIRRIESLLSYSRPDLSKKQQGSLDTLEDLRKGAGKVRDIDVQRKLLDKIGNASSARDRKSLLDILDKKREKHAARLHSAVARCAKQKFLARMERVADKVAASAEQRLAPLEEARVQLARMADQMSLQSLKPNRLHQARIQLKKIRYLAELVEDSPEGEVFVEEVKAAQDALGEWHDWEELSKVGEKHFADRASCALLREVRALFAARQAAAISALARLFSTASTPAKKPPRQAPALPLTARRA